MQVSLSTVLASGIMESLLTVSLLKSMLHKVLRVRGQTEVSDSPFSAIPKPII